MTYKTHFVGGICAGIVGVNLLNVAAVNVPGFVVVSALSSLIPDADIEGSKINNKMGVFGKAVSATSHHRGFYHTPILYIILSYLMSLFLPMNIALGFFVGTLSHLILDTFNSKGIMWLWPITRKHFHIASIRTRTSGETIFMFVMIVLTVLFVISQNVGVETFLLSLDVSPVSGSDLPKIDFHTEFKMFNDLSVENVKLFVENMLFNW